MHDCAGLGSSSTSSHNPIPGSCILLLSVVVPVSGGPQSQPPGEDIWPQVQHTADCIFSSYFVGLWCNIVSLTWFLSYPRYHFQDHPIVTGSVWSKGLWASLGPHPIPCSCSWSLLRICDCLNVSVPRSFQGPRDLRLRRSSKLKNVSKADQRYTGCKEYWGVW